MALEAVADRLQAVRAALAGQPLEAAVDHERLVAVQGELKGLARELARAAQENPAAPLPLQPAQVEAWAHDIYRPQVLAQVYQELGGAVRAVPPPPVGAGDGVAAEGRGRTARPVVSSLVSFARDVAKGVAIGLTVALLLQHFARRPAGPASRR